MSLIRGIGFFIVACLLSWGGFVHAQTEDTRESSFYYPTEVEEPFLSSSHGTKQFTRRGGIGPDNAALLRTGMWEYPQPDEDETIYGRYDGFFEPVDDLLSPFAYRSGGAYIGRGKYRSGEADIYDTQSSLTSGVYVDFGLPLTKKFDPDRAHLKVGQLYGDLVSISVTAMYTDLDEAVPRLVVNPGQGLVPKDGFNGILGVTLRGLIRLTENIYLSAQGTIYYLPKEGRVGFYFLDPSQSQLNVRLAFDKQIGDWEFVVFDQFRSHYYLSQLYAEIETNEVSQVGRYRFGRIDPLNPRRDEIFSGDNFYFVNDLGASVYWDDETEWRAEASAWRRDVWRTSNFEDHRLYYYGNFVLTYDQQDWRFVPYFQYYTRAMGDFESWRHVFWLGMRGPLTQNTNLSARVGYTTADGDRQNINRLLQNPTAVNNLGGFGNPFRNNPLDIQFSQTGPQGAGGLQVASTNKFLWEVGLENELGPLTRHSLFGGTVVAEDVTGDQFLGTYVRYSLERQFNARARARAYVQYADAENTDFSRGLEGNFVSLVGAWTQAVGDYGNLRLLASYDKANYDRAPDLTRGIYRAQYTQRLLSRLSASLAFQYTDYEYVNSTLDFREMATWLTLTRYF